MEEKIELFSKEGKYDEQVILQLGVVKKQLEKLLQDWEILQS